MYANELLRYTEDWSGTGENYFETEMGNFWGLTGTRDYCRQRARLIDALMIEAQANMHISQPFVNRVALEMALEHSLDLLTVSIRDNQGTRYLVPTMMIGLEMYQQAYDFIRYWILYDGTDEGNDDEDDDDTEGPAFLRMRGEEVSESLEVFDLNKHCSATMVFDLALTKFSIYHAVRTVQTLESGFLKNADLATAVGKMIDVPSRWLALDSNRILTQTKQLLSCVHDINKFVLPGILQPTRFLEMRPEYYGAGSEEEAALILQRSYVWWKHNKFAFQFVKNLIKNHLSSAARLPVVPRNTAARQKSAEKTASIQAELAESPAHRLMTHFDKVKSTPPVRGLFASIGASDLSLGRFPGTMRICSALVRGNADTDENLRLLFGSSNIEVAQREIEQARLYSTSAAPGSPADAAGFGPFGR